MIKKPSFVYRIVFATFFGLLMGGILTLVFKITLPEHSLPMVELCTLTTSIGICVGIMGIMSPGIDTKKTVITLGRGLGIGGIMTAVLISFDPIFLEKYTGIAPFFPTVMMMGTGLMVGAITDLLATRRFGNGIDALMADHHG